jgi:integrase/recombinase XerD
MGILSVSERNRGSVKMTIDQGSTRQGTSRENNHLTPMSPSAVPDLPADRHPALVYLASVAPGTRASVRSGLQIIAELLSGGQCDLHTMPWQALRAQHTLALRAELASRYAHGTANKMLAYVKGVLRAAWQLDLIDTEAYHRARDIKAVRGESLPRGRAVAQGELRALLDSCYQAWQADKYRSPLHLRDAALIGVLYGSGLRRAEAAALDVSDYDPGTGSLRIRAGKGNKARIAYTSAGERALLDTWLRVRAASSQGAERAGALFCPVLRGGHMRVRHMDPRTILEALQRRAKEAGVAHLTPHDLRRSMIGDLLDAGADLATVQRLAGHSGPGTTSRYDRRGEATRARAAELLHVPGPPPGWG